MTEANRFCVQFSGTDLSSVTKTRILYKESKPEDIREIWRTVNNSEAPEVIHLVTSNHSTYTLDDKNDFSVVMAMAEDQYRAHPSDPLHITLAPPRHYKLNTPPSSNPSPEQLSRECRDAANNPPAEQNAKSPLKENQMKLNSSNPAENSEGQNPGDESRKRSSDENAIVHDLSIRKNVLNTFPQDPNFSKISPSDHERNSHQFRKAINDVVERRPTNKPMFFQSYQNKQIPLQSFNDNENFTGMPQNTVTRPMPLVGASAASALLNTAQQQRLVQGNPNAQYFFQSLRSSYERYAAINWLKQLAQTNLNNGMNFPENMMELKYFCERNNYPVPSSANAHTLDKNKRKSDNLAELGSRKERSGGKRMRSSSSQSNIEFHCEQAEKYMNLPALLKKEHNSAHRSHWKHLSHVLSIWPQFAAIYKHKKYDEWSSEARDIYAISLPEEYKWSFLTLAKQGDQLCRRIKRRVEEMRQLPKEQRPEWCPSDDILKITWGKADERLQQLERIREARHTVASNLESGSPAKSSVASPSTSDRFTLASPPANIFNPASSFQRQMFGDNAFFVGQRAKPDPCFNHFNSHPAFAASIRPQLPPADIPSVSEREMKTEVVENGSPGSRERGFAERNDFFLHRMKLLAAASHEGYPAIDKPAAKEESADAPCNKSALASPPSSSSAVSPISQRHIG